MIEGDMKFDRESLIAFGVEAFDIVEDVMDNIEKVTPEKKELAS
jgi:hypothetical protein